MANCPGIQDSDTLGPLRHGIIDSAAQPRWGRQGRLKNRDWIETGCWKKRPAASSRDMVMEHGFSGVPHQVSLRL
jgi:hypothetical protein